jgi:dienelactone hydrolase
MTIIVGVDGSWPWRVARILLVGALTSRAMRVATRTSTLAKASVALGFGLVAAPAGAAIAVGHLTGGGWSLIGTGGMFAAVGGIVLVAAGAIALVTRLRWWTRLLTALALLLLAYTVAFPVAIAVYATNVPRTELGSETPSQRGLAYEDATFTTTDGVTLSGWYIPSTNRSAVVLLHGASSTRSSMLDQAVVLARHGYGVLLFDARGLGRSGGRAMDFGWYGDRDVSAAVDYLRERPDVDPGRIGAVGLSMGGEEAIGAMAADSRIRAVVAEGATNRVADDWRWLPDEYGLRGRFQLGVQVVTYSLTDLLTDASPPIALQDAAASAAPRRILLIAAGNVHDEAIAGEDIRAASPSSVTRWVVDGAEHTGGLGAQPAAWEQRVVGFLDETL